MMNQPEARDSGRSVADQSISADKKTVVYEEDGQHFRALNTLLWTIPTLAITLTGGLWFGVSKVEADQLVLKTGMLLLAGIGDIAFLLALWRLRVGVMQRYIDRMSEYCELPATRMDKLPFYVPRCLVSENFVVINIFSLMLFIAAIVSAVGVYQTWFGHDVSSPKPKTEITIPGTEKANRFTSAPVGAQPGSAPTKLQNGLTPSTHR